jgi:3-hydroxyisobutyrate dehydrogenase
MVVAPGQTTVGFIGTGVMGRSMAGHLLAAGYRLLVHSRTRGKAEDLVAAGAEWRGDPAAVASGADVVLSIVGFPSDVEEVYFGAAGVLAAARPGALLVDMTTSSPALAVRVAEAAEARGCRALDAPVSGGDIGAREARLSIMVGGARDAFDHALPVFEAMGRNIVYQGGPGSGQHTKMANQIAIASGMIGVCEAMSYAKRAGLDPDAVLRSIASGAAGSWSLTNLAPRMIAGDFAPGFFVKHFVKDMEIALRSAAELGLDAPGLELALDRYRDLTGQPGGGELGTQALYQEYLRGGRP